MLGICQDSWFCEVQGKSEFILISLFLRVSFLRKEFDLAAKQRAH